MDSITGIRLKELREQHDLSRAELARRLNYNSYNTISSWESGNSYPRAKELIQLSRLYNVSADYILGMSDVRELHSNS